MKICVVGSGYVGLVAGACLADLGNEVICVDQDADKIKMLKKGQIPFYEPGLEDLVHRNAREGRLCFGSDLSAAVKEAEVIFLAVGTPPGETGEADLTQVDAAVKEIARSLDGYKVIVNKSTVPIGTGDRVAQILREFKKPSAEFDVVSNPEFLREGSAIFDFMRPDRIVIGSSSPRAAQIMEEIYSSLEGVTIVHTDVRSAEMVKYTANAILATKISFINEIANLCERLGANIKEVAKIVGMDRRIGPDFLYAGLGYGGSCLPKDTKALIHMSEQAHYDFLILKAVDTVNQKQWLLAVEKAKKLLGPLAGKVIGILGLSFKPNTDDMREAPAVKIIAELQKEGVRIRAYDPVAMEASKAWIRDVTYCQGILETAKGADALVIATEWKQFKMMELGKIKSLMRTPVIIDGRNIFSKKKMKELGFIYAGIGR